MCSPAGSAFGRNTSGIFCLLTPQNSSWIVPGSLPLQELVFLFALSYCRALCRPLLFPLCCCQGWSQAGGAGFVLHPGHLNLSCSPPLTEELGVAWEGTGILKSCFKSDAHRQVQILVPEGHGNLRCQHCGCISCCQTPITPRADQPLSEARAASFHSWG